MNRLITLMTDFGLRDPFVGVMKGVILGICPQAKIVDITHEISPQDVKEACFALASAYRYFPEGTVHLVVVDPGVGSQRAIIAVQTTSAIFVAPDNGVLTAVLKHESILDLRRVTNEKYFLDRVSSTFHGRDIFAPVGAHLLNGVALEELGEKYHSPQLMHLRQAQREGGRIVGEIIHIDRFGNLITNIEESEICYISRERLRVRLSGREIRGLSTSYADVPSGSPLAIIGSSLLLEISVNMGNARRFFNAKSGDRVEVCCGE